MGSWTVHNGDCLEVLPTLEANSVDAIVTDPPYGLSFMGKAWDHAVPGPEFFEAMLRVAKPGANLLAFGGTRLYHRMTVAIEDAGWEVRDCLMWLYGSGFPKSHDVSKAIDKMDAAEEQESRRFRFTAWARSTGITPKQINEATGTEMGHHYTTHPTQPAIMTREHLEACRHLLGEIPCWVEREADIRSVESRNMKAREVVGVKTLPDTSIVRAGFVGMTAPNGVTPTREVNVTTSATDDAKRWQGWGTALKPAWEPIVLARKPLDGTVAANHLRHGCGGLNVDGCRVGTETVRINTWDNGAKPFGNGAGNPYTGRDSQGRWPANLILDAEAVDAEWTRFFYCPKASKADRGEDNSHPTVKPHDLMRYLCRLVTPPNGTVLDPFTGSGSTGKAAVAEGFNFIGIEMDEQYAEIARARIAHAAPKDLFAEVG